MNKPPIGLGEPSRAAPDLYTDVTTVNDLWVFVGGLIAGACIATLVLWLARRPAEPVEREVPDEGPGPVEPSPDDVFDRLTEGVVLLNDLLHPVLANRAARELLELDVSDQPLPDELMSIVRRAITSHERVEDVIDLWNPSRTSVRVVAESLGDERGVVLALRDISAEQRANRIRRQFVAHASHELKTPVASIQTLSEAISSAAADDPGTVEDFAQKLLAETARMAKLIEDLLDLSRLEDPGSFSRHPVLVSEVARGEAESIRPRSEKRRQDLDISVEDQVWTQGDEQQLSLLIRNLLDNAVRYTPEEGTVRLEVARRDDQVVITVADDGIGIPLKAQARVFERFFRVDEARSRDQGGTGLGLAIVRHVADLYGGRVELRSEFGEGSVFTVFLPATERTPQEANA